MTHRCCLTLATAAFGLALAALTGGCDVLTSKAGPSAPSTGPSPAPPKEKIAMPDKSEVTRAGASINAFGASLYGGLAKRPGNLAFSPTSVEAALAMTLGGAKGETAKEMGQVLRLTGDDGVLVGALLRALESPGRSLTLNVANRLFGEKSFAFEKPFLEKTRAAFGAPLEPVDFVGSSDAARLHINGWVADVTARRISDLLPPPAINASTRMVLVNALYFLAEWQSPFKKESTAPRPFKAFGTTDKAVPMMHQRLTSAIVSVDGAKVLKLAYKGGEAAMILALPDAVDGLAALEGKLAGAKLDEWQKALASAAPQEVDVALPKFKVEPAAPVLLSEELKRLGMPLAFDAERADFTGIGVPPNAKNRLYISEVFHKAFVKVDEKGTEAAAATAVVMAEGGGMPPKALAFKADHPFMFFIVDKTSGAALFAGRVVDPS